MTLRTIAAPLVIAVIVSADCAPKTRSSPEPVGPPPKGLLRSACPMEVAGTTVVSEDVEDGAALVFKTSKGDVADLRTLARRMAEIHNLHGTMGGGPAAPEAARPIMSISSTASVEDVEGGSRVVFRPHDPMMLDVLRRNVQVRAGGMRPGQCR